MLFETNFSSENGLIGPLQGGRIITTHDSGWSQTSYFFKHLDHIMPTVLDFDDFKICLIITNI